MGDAVHTAGSAAKRGDIVALSPGCASFGMFRNEFDRGDRFRRAVDGIGRRLAHD
jgi:UDP-N-acetylmuramoylalanine--D-glutamate ligase